jgi:peptidoglycan/xylan/chitin deacetylase (PgdA/CDA1 family)
MNRMSARQLIAPAWLALWRGWRIIAPKPKGAFRILLFHDVPKHETPAFIRLVHDLHAANRLITPAEAEGMLAGKSSGRHGAPPCLLSFDDGFASNFQLARTLLDPLGIKALFFVCPGLTKLSGTAQRRAIAANIFDGKRAPEDLDPELRLMTWDEIGALHQSGHTIGAHTTSHLRLTTLDGAGLAEQVGTGAEALARRLGRVPEWFAYTFGDVNSIDAAALAEIARHHRYCRSGVRGLNHAGTHPLALRADHVDLEASESWRRMGVEGALDPLYRTQRRQLDTLAAAL